MSHEAAPPPQVPMTADAFLAWSETIDGVRYELNGGHVFEVQSERRSHARAKGLAYRALSDAIETAGLDCEALPDGMSVRVDDWTVYEPDALVRCGPTAEEDPVVLHDPVVVVEVLSPSTRSLDVGAKYLGYLSLPSVEHYLIVDLQKRVVVHHRPEGKNTVRSAIHGAGVTLHLHPPGLTLAVDDLLPDV